MKESVENLNIPSALTTNLGLMPARRLTVQNHSIQAKALNMQNSPLTTKLRSALGLQSLAFVYAFLLAGSLGAQSVYTPYTFTTLAGQAPIGSADGTGSVAQFYHPRGVATDSSGNVYV